MIKILFSTFLFTSVCSFVCSSQVYKDLKDQGYKGPVKIVITKFYSDISFQNKNWIVNDSLHPHTVLAEYYNKSGNLTRKKINTRYDTSLIEFTYVNEIKSGWVKKDKNGIVSESAVTSFYNQDSFKETIIDASDSSKTELTYFLDNRKRTKKIEEKGFNSKAVLTYHLISRNEDDREGKYWKVVWENKLTKKTDVFDFTFLKKDIYDNPKMILVKKNGAVIDIRLVSFVYY